MSFRDTNERLAVWLTSKVGSMPMAYAFCALSLISLPAAVASRNVLVMDAWVAQTFIQLVLLPIIMVGTDVSSKRVERTIMETHAMAMQEMVANRVLMHAVHALLTPDTEDDAVALEELDRLEAAGD
jgi:hypothetical protein